MIFNQNNNFRFRITKLFLSMNIGTMMKMQLFYNYIIYLATIDNVLNAFPSRTLETAWAELRYRDRFVKVKENISMRCARSCVWPAFEGRNVGSG